MKPKGIRRKGNKWEVNVRVKGDLRTAYFPLDTPDWQMSAWREAQRGKVPDEKLPTGTLGRDAVRYLRTVKHAPDYGNKHAYLTRWIKVLGRTRDRSTITSPEIGAILSTWLAAGLSPTTVRHYRTALANVWRALDGPRAPNPVLDTARPADPAPEPRAAPLTDVQAVLAALPAGKTRARLRLLLATGLPHKQIMQLTPADWDRDRRVLAVQRRRKGKGAKGRILQLSDAGMAALAEFAAADAWGPFWHSTMRGDIRKAAARAGVPPFRPYDVRHLHATLIYQETGDLQTTARLLGHVGTKTTERYTQGAWAGVDAAATAKVGEKLAPQLELGENDTQSD